jgi:hypothetical protein
MFSCQPNSRQLVTAAAFSIYKKNGGRGLEERRLLGSRISDLKQQQQELQR